MHFLNDTHKIRIFFLFLVISTTPGKSAFIPDSLLAKHSIIRSFEQSKILYTSPNYSLAFDQSGIMFLGQQDKISIHNGKSWKQVFIKGQVLLTASSNNLIYFATGRQLGYLLPDSSLEFSPRFIEFAFQGDTALNGNIRKIAAIGKNIYIQTDSSLYCYDSKDLKILDRDFSDGRIFLCRQNLVCLKGRTHACIYLGSNLIFKQDLALNDISLILPYKNGFLLFTREGTCFSSDDSLQNNRRFGGFSIPGAAKGFYLNQGEYIVSGSSDQIWRFFEDGAGFFSLLKNELPAGNEILEIIPEPSGNIWILKERSLYRIEYPSSLNKIADLNGITNNINDIEISDNQLFISSSSGLIKIDPLSGNIATTDIHEPVYQLFSGKGILFACAVDRIFIIRNDTVKYVLPGVMLDVSMDPRNNLHYVSFPGKIQIFSGAEGNINSLGVLELPFNPVKMVSLDSLLWMTDGKSIYSLQPFIDMERKTIFTEYNGFSGISDLFLWDGRLHVLSKNKIFSLANDKFEYERVLTDEFVKGDFIRIHRDIDNNLIFLSKNLNNKLAISLGNSKYLSNTDINLPFQGGPGFPGIAARLIRDEIVLLAYGTGVYSKNLHKSFQSKRSFETIITKIEAGEQSLFLGVSYNYFRVPLRNTLNTIPYSRNDLKIELSTTNYLDPEVRYQYYIEGSGKLWSEWVTHPVLELKNLHEGEYELRLRSKDLYNETSPVTTLIFRILPPFYRSWWAYLIYCLSAGILLFMAYKSYLLYRHKRREESPVKVNTLPEPGSIPVIHSTPGMDEKGKKYDFFSNIDEDKDKEKTRWEKYEMVTVLFSDIQGFTKIAESMNPESLIDELDRFFFHFDSVVEKYNIEKIKTIGDAYMAAGGIPKKTNTNPIEVVLAALEMQNYMKQLKKTKIDIWDLRIGIHSGPVIAGIIGHKKRSFDIWGDTVNTASRMESTGEPGKVNISSETYKLVKDYFICDYRGKLPVKYKGNIDMYFVRGLRPELSINLAGLPNRKFFLKLQILRLNDLEEEVFSKLEAELHKDLYFHTVSYARHLYQHSELITKAAGVDLEETLLIKTASLLMNTGYTEVYENHENRSAIFARTILQEYNYSEKQITLISNLILSTKWPPDPRNVLEMILYDIKMEYLGRADYTRLYKLLFLEQNQYLKSVDEQEFKRRQIKVLEQYKYYTESARRLREVTPEEQIERIKDDDWK